MYILYLYFILDIHIFSLFFFFNDTATTEIYTLSLHDALPISADIEKRFPGKLADKFLKIFLRLSDPCIVQTPQDRKSTRLNSSHSQISYAVFCLKKKKNYKYEINSVNTNTDVL